MNPDKELESGLPPPRSTHKGSVLGRLAHTAFRFLSAPTDEPSAPPPTRTENKTNKSTAKLWSIYVGEAERYDKVVVESWRADMEGMLIFSGLFSASLTAFLIESYKKRDPPPCAEPASSPSCTLGLNDSACPSLSTRSPLSFMDLYFSSSPGWSP